MPRPSSRYTVNGTRDADAIIIGAAGVTKNGAFEPVDSNLIASGVLVKGNAGDDQITGGGGGDELQGGAGNDTLIGGAGLDRLIGGAGDDTLIDLDLLETDENTTDNLDPNANIGSIFDGGRGYDTLDFTNYSTGLAIYGPGFETEVAFAFVGDHAEVTHGGSSVSGRITNIEMIIGSSNSDVIWGDLGVNEIHGGGGNDYLLASSLSRFDNDQIFGDDGDDLIGSGAGNDQLTGGQGTDRFVFDVTQNNGQDVILDYTPSEDSLVFSFAAQGPTWASYSYLASNDSIIGTYANGSSVILYGITDANLVTVQVTDTQYVFDYYL